MSEGSDEAGGEGEQLTMSTGPPSPDRYQSTESKERFAVAKYFGMGEDGEWSVPEIAEALDCSERQVYRYVNESQIGQQAREMLATTEAEWRLDMAVELRKEVKRLESIEKQLLQRKKAVPTGYETKTVRGTPTGDRNIRLPDDSDDYRLKLPVPTDFETVPDYKQDLQAVQSEKRQYLKQIAKLLGLNEADKHDVDNTLAGRHDEVKVIEIRESEDPYPEAQEVDMSEAAEDAEVDAEYVHDPDDDQ